MTWIDWTISIVAIAVFLFGIGPIAMHMWGSMFGKGLSSSISKYFKQKRNKNERKTSE